MRVMSVRVLSVRVLSVRVLSVRVLYGEFCPDPLRGISKEIMHLLLISRIRIGYDFLTSYKKKILLTY